MIEKVATDDVDECSSYGTDYSTEEMGTTTIEVSYDMGKAMKSLQAFIEVINREISITGEGGPHSVA